MRNRNSLHIERDSTQLLVIVVVRPNTFFCRMTSINIAKLGSGSELNPTVMVGETRQENNLVIIEVS